MKKIFHGKKQTKQTFLKNIFKVIKIKHRKIIVLRCFLKGDIVKKIFLIVFLLPILLLGGCKKEIKASEKALQTGRECLKVADKLIDKEIEAESAGKKIDEIEQELDYVIYQEEKTLDLDIDTAIIELAISISQISENEENIDSVLEKRNELAEILGESKKTVEEKEELKK